MKEGLPAAFQWKECQGCGKRILFARVTKLDGEEGHVPLDPVPAVYHVAYNEDGSAEATKATRHRVMVSHFATCPKANEFSGGKKT